MKDLLRRLRCWITFHDLYVVQDFTDFSRKCGCHRCRRYFAMNYEYQMFLPWSDEFEDYYERLTGASTRL